MCQASEQLPKSTDTRVSELTRENLNMQHRDPSDRGPDSASAERRERSREKEPANVVITLF